MNAPQLDMEASAIRFCELFDLYKGDLVPKRNLNRRAAEILVARAACARLNLPKPDKWPDSDDEMKLYAGVRYARLAA